MKKVLAGCSLAVVVVLGLLIYGCDRLTDDMCGNQVVQSVVSPDGHVKAIVFVRDCGATTNFSTQISIIRADDELPNAYGNVFIAEGFPMGAKGNLPVHVTWSGARQLQVAYPEQSEVHVQNTSNTTWFGWFRREGVHIRYAKTAER